MCATFMKLSVADSELTDSDAFSETSLFFDWMVPPEDIIEFVWLEPDMLLLL